MDAFGELPLGSVLFWFTLSKVEGFLTILGLLVSCVEPASCVDCVDPLVLFWLDLK